MGAELNHINSVIDANVKQNGNNEITGDIMNAVLKEIASATLQGYHFMGVLKSDSQPPANSPWIYVANNVTYGAYQFGADEFGVLYYDDVPMATPVKKILFSASNAVAAHNADPTAHQFLLDEIDAIEDMIPAEASSTNKLADKQYVDDALATKADKVTGATNGNVATLNASGEVVDSGKALSALANDADVVHKTGAETVSGVKTFSDGLITGSLFFGSQITAISISGSATWNLSDLKTMMKIVLNNASNTITLPQGGNNPFRFQIIITQDSTGGRDLSFTVANSGTIYNPSEFDFTNGEGDQLCICTMIWTGNEYIYECTPYVGA